MLCKLDDSSDFDHFKASNFQDYWDNTKYTVLLPVPRLIYLSKPTLCNAL